MRVNNKHLQITIKELSLLAMFGFEIPLLKYFS